MGKTMKNPSPAHNDMEVKHSDESWHVCHAYNVMWLVTPTRLVTWLIHRRALLYLLLVPGQLQGFLSMDSREDFPRVSIGSVQHWHAFKNNYKEAALQQLELSGLSGKDKAAAQEYLEQVFTSPLKQSFMNLISLSLLKGHLVLLKQTSE